MNGECQDCGELHDPAVCCHCGDHHDSESYCCQCGHYHPGTTECPDRNIPCNSYLCCIPA